VSAYVRADLSRRASRDGFLPTAHCPLLRNEDRPPQGKSTNNSAQTSVQVTYCVYTVPHQYVRPAPRGPATDGSRAPREQFTLGKLLRFFACRATGRGAPRSRRDPQCVRDSQKTSRARNESPGSKRCDAVEVGVRPNSQLKPHLFIPNMRTEALR
jgi:hypothetical protein